VPSGGGGGGAAPAAGGAPAAAAVEEKKEEKKEEEKVGCSIFICILLLLMSPLLGFRKSQTMTWVSVYSIDHVVQECLYASHLNPHLLSWSNLRTIRDIPHLIR
jgi:hypothetical protein